MADVTIPEELLVEVWQITSSIAIGLAELGRWEAEPHLDHRFDRKVYAEFLSDFDVCRKLIRARRLLTESLESSLGSEPVEALAANIEPWIWEPR
jgi:hypothetical protein